MKCSKCGYKTRSLPAMAKHYRKKHPAAMKRKAKGHSATHAAYVKGLGPEKNRFCPHCGGFLG